MNCEIKWYEDRLAERLRLARRYVCRMLDGDRDGEPFFGIGLDADGRPRRHHAVHIGIPHVTGRALDCLFQIENLLGERADAEAEETYIRYLFGCCDLEDYLPVYYENGMPIVEFHNLRECLEGLYWLIRLRGSGRARKVAEGMLSSLARITDWEEGVMSRQLAIGLGKGEKYRNPHHPIPLASGRLIGPLLWYYRLTGSTLALRLADCYAGGAMRVCYTEDGRFTDRGGNHVHSHTSTLSGLLEYALFTGDEGMLERLERVYRNGLAENMASYGWIKEQLWLETDQGEVNQIGDILQFQLMMAAHREPDIWYARAEAFMRGGMLPSQVLSTDGYMRVVENPRGDFERELHDIAIGGFGFPTPTAHLQTPHSAVNTIDITQGAVQGICRVTRHIVTGDRDGLRWNLFFSWDTPYGTVESRLPREGRAALTLREEGNLRIRIPANIREGSFRVLTDGRETPWTLIGGYAAVGRLPAGSRVEIAFDPAVRVAQEFICHQLYTVKTYGEQVVSVTPQKGVYPLFYDFTV